MSNLEIELNSEGVRELLCSGEIKATCESLAAEALNRCGEGYAMNSYVGRNRANAMIYADTRAAENDNAENNTIIKALGGR